MNETNGNSKSETSFHQPMVDKDVLLNSLDCLKHKKMNSVVEKNTSNNGLDRTYDGISTIQVNDDLDPNSEVPNSQSLSSLQPHTTLIQQTGQCFASISTPEVPLPDAYHHSLMQHNVPLPTPYAPQGAAVLLHPSSPPFANTCPSGTMDTVILTPPHSATTDISSPEPPHTDGGGQQELNNHIPMVNGSTPSPVATDMSVKEDQLQMTPTEYYVLVHVNVGTTFSVRDGEEIRHITGPATVRMVSNTGPPLPMPMQVPAGHVVHQIVDEEGILKHVMLSLYPDPHSTQNGGAAGTPLHHHLHHPQHQTPLGLSSNPTNGAPFTPGANVILDPSHHPHFVHPQQLQPHTVVSTGSPHHPLNHPFGPASHTASPVLPYSNPFMHHPQQVPLQSYHPSPATNNLPGHVLPQQYPSPQQLFPQTTTTTKVHNSKPSYSAVVNGLLVNSPPVRHDALLDVPESAEEVGVGEYNDHVESAGKTVDDETPHESANLINGEVTQDGPTKCNTNSPSEVIVATKLPQNSADSTIIDGQTTAFMRSNAEVASGNGSSHVQPVDVDKDPEVLTNAEDQSPYLPAHRRSRNGIKKSAPSKSDHPLHSYTNPAGGNNSVDPTCSLVGHSTIHSTSWPMEDHSSPVHECSSFPNHNLQPPPVFHRRHHDVPAHLVDYSLGGSPVYGQEEKLIDPVQTPCDPQWGPDESTNCAIVSMLSDIPTPEVSDVKSSSALIHLSSPIDLTVRIKCAPEMNEHDPPETNGETIQSDEAITESWIVDENAIQFELYLAERDCNARFNCVFIGEATDISLQDLRPGCVYYLKYCCIFADLRGNFSSTAHFTTLATEPSAPRSVTVVGQSRTSLHLKWSAALENGSRITAYTVEYAPTSQSRKTRTWAATDSHHKSDTAATFIEGYHGLTKSCRLKGLNPSTKYLVRVMAKNALGQGPWSSVISTSTSGNPPTSPKSLELVSSDVHSLTLSWTCADRGPNTGMSSGSSPSHAEDISYRLEMEDETMGHGFVTVFDGTGTEHRVENLRRNTTYRFRLAACNNDGRSAWTDVVSFSTLPDCPGAPKELVLDGPVCPTHIRLRWSPPTDDGGSPVCAYRLELRLPILGTELLLDREKDVSQSLPCWPRVIGCPDQTIFACIPPSSVPATSKPVPPKHVGDESANPTTSVCGLCYCPSPQDLDTPSPIESLLQLDTGDAVSSSSCIHTNPHLNSDRTSNDTYQFTWFIIYEGKDQQLSLDHLLPGLQLCFRVRAKSVDSGGGSSTTAWGRASRPLHVPLPAVTPFAPSSPRIMGQAKPSSLRLVWDAPTNTGGSPITAYEVWQKNLSNGQSSSEEDEATPMTIAQSPPICLSSPSPYSSRSPSSDSSGKENAGNLKTSGHLTTTSTKHRVKRFRGGRHFHNNNSGTKACPDPLQSPNSDQGRFVCSVPCLECRVNGLRPGRSYSFRVRACNMIGRGPWSAWSTLSTVSCPPTAILQAPQLQPLNTNCLRICWDMCKHANGAPITSYAVEWKPLLPKEPYHTVTPSDQPRSCSEAAISAVSQDDSELSDGFQLIYSGGSRTFEFEGVQPSSRLSFRVCAVNEAGRGAWSPIGTCLMPPDRPGQPGGLHVKQCEPHRVRLCFCAPQPNGCPITSFQIQLSQASEFDQESAKHIEFPSPVNVINGTGDSDLVDHWLMDLTPDSFYVARICAYNSLGYGPYSAALRFRTLPPLPLVPVFSTPTQLTATSVRLHWSQPNDNSNNSSKHPTSNPSNSPHRSGLVYTLQICREPDSDWVTVYEGIDTSFKVPRLNENTSYAFRVNVANQTGSSCFSESLSILTLRLPLPMVRGLKVSDLNTDSCQIEWTPVNQQSGPDPILYVVHLLPVVRAELEEGCVTQTAAQIYRGAQSSCRATDLLPDTEYICRVTAVRLCLPQSLPACTGSEPFDPDKIIRQIIPDPVYYVTEVHSALSHSLTFTTKPLRSPSKSASTVVPNNVENLIEYHGLWRILSNIFYQLMRRGNSSRSQGNALGSKLVSKSANMAATSSSAAGVLTSSPSWRRRTVGMGLVVQSASIPSSQSSQAQRHSQPSNSLTNVSGNSPLSTAHHASYRKVQPWFRRSDRKLTILFLLLFVLATFCGYFGLKHALSVELN